MTTRTVKTRDAATAVLRKLGVDKANYGKFIKTSPNAPGFEVDLGTAEASVKPAKKAVAPKGDQPAKVTCAHVAETLILEGQTNQQVWEVIKEKFSLDDNKKSYPAWYRSRLRRQGKLAR